MNEKVRSNPKTVLFHSITLYVIIIIINLAFISQPEHSIFMWSLSACQPAKALFLKNKTYTVLIYLLNLPLKLKLNICKGLFSKHFSG